MATIMDLVLEVINKDTDKILVQFGNILQCLGVYWVDETWDILIIDAENDLNMLTVNVD